MAERPTSGLRGAFQSCRGLIGWMVLFSAGINLLYLAPSIFMMQVYDRVLTTGGVTTLGALSVVLLFALVVLALLDLSRQRLGVRIGLRLDRLLSRTVVELGIRKGRGSDTSRNQAVRDLDTIRQSLTSPAAAAALDVPWTLVFIAACFLIHPLIGLATLGGGVVLVLIAARNERAMRPMIARAMDLAPRCYDSREADQATSEAIHALGMRGVLVDRQLKWRRNLLVEQTRASRMQAAYGSASRFWRLLLQSAVLAAGARLAVDGQISPGALIAGSILAARALAPLEQVVAGLRQLEQARVAFRNLTALTDDAPIAGERTILPRPKAGLRVERVSVRIAGTDRVALNNISFAAECGEVLGVIGPNGAGKSTLARVVAGAIAPDAGAVRLDGADFTHWEPDALGRHIGYLPQQVALLEGTVGENIRRFAPRSDDADALTIAAAQAAGAHEMILRLPKGYDTALGAHGRGLSLGQAQRIALARALYDEPVLIVLDEPNAHLDAEGEAALTHAIHQAKARGAVVIAVAHRAGMMATADRVLVLRDGAIDSLGARDDIMRSLGSPRGGSGNMTPLRVREN